MSIIIVKGALQDLQHRRKVKVTLSGEMTADVHAISCSGIYWCFCRMILLYQFGTASNHSLIFLLQKILDFFFFFDQIY